MEETIKKLPAGWQQPNESEEAYEAFAYYRSLGPGRTLQRVARYLDKSHQLMERWSVRWCWRDRLAGRVPDDIGRRGIKKRRSTRGHGTAGMQSTPFGLVRTTLEGDQGPTPPGKVAVRVHPKGPIYHIFKHTLEDFLAGYKKGSVVADGPNE